MGLKIYKPTSPARRHTSVNDCSDLTAKRSLKNRLKIRKQQSGRNFQGKITVRHRGGGAKRFIRQIDWQQDKFDVPGRIAAVEYDPSRAVRLAVVVYADGEKRYSTLPEGLKVGDQILSSRQAIKPEVGHRLPLEFIPIGMLVHNLELISGRGAALVRSAGGSAQLMAVEGDYAQLKMPSGEIRKLSKKCSATIGQLGMAQQQHLRIGKAGRYRHLGVRPSVRGKAMNPVDHPHGGGEGVNPIGLKHPKTKWGKPAYGVHTRKHHRPSDYLIIRRRQSKNR